MEIRPEVRTLFLNIRAGKVAETAGGGAQFCWIPYRCGSVVLGSGDRWCFGLSFERERCKDMRWEVKYFGMISGWWGRGVGQAVP